MTNISILIRFILGSLFIIFLTSISAQPRKSLVEVVVTPTETDWTYSINERADFIVSILLNGQAIPDIELDYEIGPEQMDPVNRGKATLDGMAAITIKGISLAKPGFVNCKVSAIYMGKTYKGMGTAGFDPYSIQPVVTIPDDFDAFWAVNKAALATIPINPMLTLMPEYCTPKINVYHVRLDNIPVQNWRGPSHLFGMLSMPAQSEKYPAILGVPGAGVRAYGRDDRAAEGVIVFKIGIHGIPVNMDPILYQELGKGALAQYATAQLNDRNDYYYKRVFMGCVRAVDFITTLPEYDGDNLAVTGGSQGGALSIISAGLDDRIKYLAAFYPAMSDMMGYLEGRAGGWPHMFRDYNKAENPNWTAVAPYYDVVNFARRLNIPGWYSWGYNDNVCPPTSMFAAYNVITSKKELYPFYETAHWTYPEQHAAANAWLYEMLGLKK